MWICPICFDEYAVADYAFVCETCKYKRGRELDGYVS